MRTVRRIGVLGGTFDPIHFGHLDAAEAVRAALELDEVLFIPSHDPPHKTNSTEASVHHRFALAALAIQDCPGYRLSDMELLRQGASYTVDTLRALHACGFAATQIFFTLGADAFAEIASWRAFPQVLDLAHFAVVSRPGTTLDAAVARVPEIGARLRPEAERGRGGNGTTGVYLVPAHTRDVSSTTIRARVAAGQSIDDLVPAAVARHIVVHHLYGAVDHLHGEEGNGSDPHN